jgi:hypothetical protein
VAWDIIQLDLMTALDVFWRHDTKNLHATNEAEVVKDYRLISLIHTVGKLISKLLANRLAPRIASLVHGVQCAFIKGRSIHENVKFVNSLARLLNARRKATVLFKADLSKAFDSSVWAFLIEILHHMGFPTAWLNSTIVILRLTSTRFLLKVHHVKESAMLMGCDKVTPCRRFSLSFLWRC